MRGRFLSGIWDESMLNKYISYILKNLQTKSVNPTEGEYVPKLHELWVLPPSMFFLLIKEGAHMYLGH
jgi:hypothetical protein